LSAVPYLFAVVGLYFVPRHSDRQGERYWHIVVVSGLAAITMAVSAWTRTPLLQFFFICLTAFSLYSIQAVVWALPGEFLTGAGAAVGIATMNSLANLGGLCWSLRHRLDQGCDRQPRGRPVLSCGHIAVCRDDGVRREIGITRQGEGNTLIISGKALSGFF
jgi:hypothetical protein